MDTQTQNALALYEEMIYGTALQIKQLGDLTFIEVTGAGNGNIWLKIFLNESEDVWSMETISYDELAAQDILPKGYSKDLDNREKFFTNYINKDKQMKLMHGYLMEHKARRLDDLIERYRRDLLHWAKNTR